MLLDAIRVKIKRTSVDKSSRPPIGRGDIHRSSREYGCTQCAQGFNAPLPILLIVLRKTITIKCKEIIKKHATDFSGTLSDKEVMTLCRISRNSYYKYKRELKTESIQGGNNDVRTLRTNKNMEDYLQP